MADKIVNDITLLFKTKLDDKSKNEIGKQLKGILENAVIGFDETEAKNNLVPIINMMQKLFDKAEIKFDADKLFQMPSQEALQAIANISAAKFQTAFERALEKSGGVKIDFGDDALSGMTEPLERLVLEVSDINQKLANETKKSVNEIEQSINKLNKVKPKKINTKVIVDGVEQEVKQEVSKVEQAIGKIEKTLEEVNHPKAITTEKSAIRALEKARDKYAESVKNDDPWEVQYQHMISFVSKYEAMTKKIKPLIDTSRPEFKQLYDMLSTKSGDAKISLEHFVDVAKGHELSEYKNQPWARESTLKKIEQTLKNGISVKDADNGGDNNKSKAHQSQNVHTDDSKNDAPNTKAPINSDMSNADNVDRDALIQGQEIIHQKIENAKRKIEDNEKKIEEIKEDIAKRKVFKAYKGIGAESSEYAERDDVYSSYNADYYTTDISAAQSYATDDDAHVVIAEISPKDPLEFKAKDYDESGDYAKVLESPTFLADLKRKLKEKYAATITSEKKLQKKYQDVDNLTVSNRDVDGFQALINEIARDAGFDSVIFNDVLDFASNEVDGMGKGERASVKKRTSQTIAVLTDEILKVIGFHKVERTERGKGKLAGETKEKPEYYHMPIEENDDGDFEDKPVSDASDDLKEKLELELRIDSLEKENKTLKKEIETLKGQTKTQVQSRNDSVTESTNLDVTNDSLTEQTTLLEKVQKLTTYIDEKYLSTGKHLSDFLDDLQSESNKLDAELKEILTTLRLIDDSGKLTFDVKRNGEEGGGTTHNGALISDDFVLIERDDYESVANSHLPDNTQNAVKDGVNVAEVLGYVPSKHTKGFFDIQGTAKGHNLFENGVISQDVVNATEEQLEQLVLAFIKARDYGFNIENGGSNIVYDKENGFSFYDLEEMSKDDAEFWNSKSEAEKKLIAIEDLFSLFSGINRDHSNFNSDDNVISFTGRIKNVISSKGIVANDDVDDIGRNYEDIYDDVFSGNIEDESEDFIMMLQAEANAHRQNAEAIRDEVGATKELNKTKAQFPFPKKEDFVAGGVVSEVATTSSGSAEIRDSIQTEELRQLLSTITYNVKVVQDAEPVEDNKVSIDEAALESVLNRITYNVKIAYDDADKQSNKISIDESILENVLKRITYNVKLAHDDNDKQANKIAIDETILESTLKRVFTNVLNPHTEQNDSEPKKEPWALENTLQSVKEVLDIIKINTDKTESLEVTPVKVEIGNVLATENTLAAIKTAVEAINTKVVKGSKAKTSEGGSNKKVNADKKNAESYAGSQYFPEKLKTQAMYLAKLRAQLMTTGKLTDDVDAKIYELLDGLNQVKNGPDFSRWNQQFLQLKTSIGIADLFDDYEKLGKLQATAETSGAFVEREKYEQFAREVQLKTQMLGLDKERNAEQLSALQLAQENAYISEKDIQYAKEQKRLFTEYVSLVKQIGKLDGIISSDVANAISKQNAQTEKDALMRLADEIRPKIDLTREDLISAGAASMAGEEASAIVQRQKALVDLAKQHKELGKLQAQEAHTQIAELQKKIDAQRVILKLTQEEQDVLAKITEDAKQDALNKRADKDEKRIVQKQMMVGKASNAVSRAENTWIGAVSLMTDPDNNGVIPKDFAIQVDAYRDKLESLREKQEELKHSAAPVTDEQRKALEQQSIELVNQINSVNRLTDEIGGLVAEYQKLSGTNVDEAKSQTTTLTKESSLTDYEIQLRKYAKSITNGKAQIKSFNAETKTLTYVVKTGAHEFTEYTAAVRNLDHQLVSVQGTTKRTETFFEATARKMKELTSYFSGMAIFNQISQELRRGIQYVREIDLALTELKKVTDETEESYDQFLQTAAKTGSRLGTTISAVTEAVATFAKLGYTMEQATEMAESAIVYKNVGDNIASTEDAADSIISTMKGFKLEASESMAIVDRFNEVGNRFAITSQGIGEALRLSASALSEGSNSLDESIALITAANEVVNDPSSVGTALKTLTLRLRGSKTE